MSWGLRLFNGKGERQIAVLLPNPFLDQDDRFLKQPDWCALRSGTSLGSTDSD
jgi:hypothetical protein